MNATDAYRALMATLAAMTPKQRAAYWERYDRACRALEQAGMTRSDAQAIADREVTP